MPREKFLDFMMKLDKLFYGLVQLKNNKLSHLDIKSNNIVIKDNKSNFKFIDFGLSAEYKNLKHFKKRAYTEAHTKRIYLYYPPEFLFSQSSEAFAIYCISFSAIKNSMSKIT